MFCLFTQRFPEEFLIKRLDVRVLMGLAESLACVFPVKGVRSGVQYLRMPVMKRLPASADAASRTCHDLYRMIFIAPVSDVLQQVSCISEAVRYTDFQFESVQIDCRPSDSVHSSDSLEIDRQS